MSELSEYPGVEPVVGESGFFYIEEIEGGAFRIHYHFGRSLREQVAKSGDALLVSSFQAVAHKVLPAKRELLRKYQEAAADCLIERIKEMVKPMVNLIGEEDIDSLYGYYNIYPFKGKYLWHLWDKKRDSAWDLSEVIVEASPPTVNNKMRLGLETTLIYELPKVNTVGLQRYLTGPEVSLVNTWSRWLSKVTQIIKANSEGLANQEEYNRSDQIITLKKEIRYQITRTTDGLYLLHK